MDELMSYVSRSRKSGMASQLYDFLHNLSETARGEHNVVLVVSIPASELEMTAEDQSDYNRFKKMLDRLGKPVVMSAEAETSEIIRRRLFEWDLRAVGQDGRVLLTKDALATCNISPVGWISEAHPPSNLAVCLEGLRSASRAWWMRREQAAEATGDDLPRALFTLRVQGRRC